MEAVTVGTTDVNVKQKVPRGNQLLLLLVRYKTELYV